MFDDLNDPEDGFDASDTVADIVANLILRVRFIIIARRVEQARVERLIEDLELVRRRVLSGDID